MKTKDEILSLVTKVMSRSLGTEEQLDIYESISNELDISYEYIGNLESDNKQLSDINEKTLMRVGKQAMSMAEELTKEPTEEELFEEMEKELAENVKELTW